MYDKQKQIMPLKYHIKVDFNLNIELKGKHMLYIKWMWRDVNETRLMTDEIHNEAFCVLICDCLFNLYYQVGN